MKRSEAIQDLASELICQLLENKVSSIPFDIAQDVSEALLNKQEQLGFHPPEWLDYNPSERKRMNALPDDFIFVSENEDGIKLYAIRSYGWEKE